MQWFGIAAYAASNGGERLGLVVDEKVYDAQDALKASGVQLPTDLGALLAHWESSGAIVKALEDAGAAIRSGKLELPVQRGAIGVPYSPTRIFATASNYYEHAAEMGTKLAARSESTPYIFIKADSSITATKTAVVMPSNTMKLDWEVELAVIIGKGGRNISAANAYEHIAG